LSPFLEAEICHRKAPAVETGSKGSNDEHGDR
jgi:hypothetical protein